MYLAKIYVTLKPTVNDPQGQTVRGSLLHLGFSRITDVRVGKYLEVRVDESDRSRAETQVADMCHRLLANPVIEEYHFDLEKIAQGSQLPDFTPQQPADG